MVRVPARPLVLAACAALAAPPAHATFHLMQIEQVIGGVCGRVDQQAVQLRMRGAGQNLVSGKQIVAFDAAGANPVVIVTFDANVTSGAGRRILVTSSEFDAAGNGPGGDFTMDALIPASYLAAGKIVFRDDPNPPVWSLAWGGAGYTGTNTGSMDNDVDGVFNPPFAGPLSWTTDQAILFDGVATDPSTNNAADYVLTPDEATFFENGLASAPVNDCLFGDGFETNGFQGWDAVSSP
jgi:hypothetical protein